MSIYATILCYAMTVVFLVLAADKVMRHDTSTALRLCMVEHSYDVCFQALNR